MRRTSTHLLLAAGAAFAGCSPAVPREELGNVVYEIPSVPGAEVPYQIPAIGHGESPGGAGPDTPPPADPSAV